MTISVSEPKAKNRQRFSSYQVGVYERTFM